MVIYWVRGGLDIMAALPYLIGGAAGGWAGGRWFKGVKMPWLKRIFGLLLIYGVGHAGQPASCGVFPILSQNTAPFPALEWLSRGRSAALCT